MYLRILYLSEEMNANTNRLKQLLLIMLTLSILGYSSVWAGSIQSNYEDGSDHFHSHDLEQAHDHTNHDVDSDHCCHASAHLVGLMTRLHAYHEHGLSKAPEHQFSYDSRSLSPPYRPPLS